MDNPEILSVETADEYSAVRIKCHIALAQELSKDLGLAPALSWVGHEWRSLWVGPGEWIIMEPVERENRVSPDAFQRFGGEPVIVVDITASVVVFRVSGPGARRLLASDCGLDFREQSFAPGACARTKMANISVIVVALGNTSFEVLVDSSLASYFQTWVRRSIPIYAGVSSNSRYSVTSGGPDAR